ncbi:hypothetical protein AVEN_69621-1, partial [Araneus ventricosus]
MRSSSFTPAAIHAYSLFPYNFLDSSVEGHHKFLYEKPPD